MNQLFFDSNFVSAIVGALLGGMLALGAQLLTFRNERRIRAGEKRDQQIAHCLAILTKLRRMHTQLFGMVQIFDRLAAKAEPGQEAWQWAKPIAALPMPTSFSVEELSASFELEAPIYNDLLLFNDRYEVAVSTYALYVKERGELIAQIRVQHVSGDVANYVFDEEQKTMTAAKRAALNQLLPTMHQHNTADEQQARALIHRMGSLVNEKLGGNITIDFTGDPASLPS